MNKFLIIKCRGKEKLKEKEVKEVKEVIAACGC